MPNCVHSLCTEPCAWRVHPHTHSRGMSPALTSLVPVARLSSRWMRPQGVVAGPASARPLPSMDTRRCSAARRALSARMVGGTVTK
jgi:hypothetical protein